MVLTYLGRTANWTGLAGTTEWTDAANWNTGEVPTLFDDVIVPNILGATTITHSSGNSSFSSLVFLSIDDSLSIENNSTLRLNEVGLGSSVPAGIELDTGGGLILGPMATLAADVSMLEANTSLRVDANDQITGNLTILGGNVTTGVATARLNNAVSLGGNLGNNASGEVEFSGPITLTANDLNIGTGSADAAIRISGGIDDGLNSFDLAFLGAGTIYLDSAATHGGFTTIATDVEVNNVQTFSDFTLLTGRMTTNSVVTINGSSFWVGGEISGLGAFVTNQGTLSLSGSDKTLSGNIINDGTISHTAGVLNMESSSGISVSALGDYELDFGPSNVAPISFTGLTPGLITVAGTFRNLGSGTHDIEVGVDVSGTIDVQAGDLRFNSSSPATSYTYTNSTISIASGASFQLLEGTHVAMGPETVSGEGSFFIDGNVTNASSWDITDATLGGFGPANEVTVTSGRIAPGFSPGILTTNDVTFGDDTVFEVEIGGTTPGNTNFNHDQLDVVGTVSIGNNVTLETIQWLNFAPPAGSTYTIIENDGVDPITGTFAGLAEGATISNFMGLGRNATISYVGGSGNDVVVTTAGRTAVWDGGAGTNEWNDALNWDNDALPGVDDDVLIPDLLGGTPITHSSGSNVVNSLRMEGDGSLVISGGSTLQLNSASNVAGLVRVEDGTLTLGSELVAGSYEQLEEGSLVLTISNIPFRQGKLTVTGSADIAGSLTIDVPVGGVNAAPGDVVDAISYGSLTGGFDDILGLSGQPLDGGGTVDLAATFHSNQVRLTVVPPALTELQSSVLNIPGSDGTGHVEVDSGDNVYRAGTHSTDANFEIAGASVATTPTSGTTVYLAKYNSNDELIWAENLDGANATKSGVGNRAVITNLSSLAVDASGNAYLAGSYEGTIDFDPGPGVDNRVGATGTLELFCH